METRTDDGAAWREVVGWLRAEDRVAGIPTTGPRVVEVWSLCGDCERPTRLLGREWHHQGPSDHPAVLDLQRPATAAHAYALADLCRDRRTR